MTSGSTVERIAALVGPTRSSPAKKRLIAATVETTARQPSHAQPAPVRSPGRNSPSSVVPISSEAAAPVHTSVASARGRTRPAIPSLMRM